ncbi:hypothetical protein, partial [Amycolatopsis sp. H20-H5]|uniref:hypothetical protein n=1 Tax=Amycolatopsis sp. H20-H5 TaxID=3046309 RepID=UPI002DBD29F8
LFSGAVLTADHAGVDVIEPGSTLDRIVPALVPDGPWLAWRGAHRPDPGLVRERVRAYLGRSAKLPGTPDGHRLLAAATGLTTASVRRAVDDIEAPDSAQVLEWRARWRRRVGHILAAEDITLPVPGEIVVRGDPLSAVFRAEWDHQHSLARLFVEASANVLSAAFRDGDPVLLHGPDRVGFLVELTRGEAVWRTGAAGPHRLRMPAVGLIGHRRAYLAVSVEPDEGRERTISRQRTVVTAGQFEL